jgi:hypothetical protein
VIRLLTRNDCDTKFRKLPKITWRIMRNFFTRYKSDVLVCCLLLLLQWAVFGQLFNYIFLFHEDFSMLFVFGERSYPEGIGSPYGNFTGAIGSLRPFGELIIHLTKLVFSNSFERIHYIRGFFQIVLMAWILSSYLYFRDTGLGKISAALLAAFFLCSGVSLSVSSWIATSPHLLFFFIAPVAAWCLTSDREIHLALRFLPFAILIYFGAMSWQSLPFVVFPYLLAFVLFSSNQAFEKAKARIALSVPAFGALMIAAILTGLLVKNMLDFSWPQDVDRATQSLSSASSLSGLVKAVLLPAVRILSQPAPITSYFHNTIDARIQLLAAVSIILIYALVSFKNRTERAHALTNHRLWLSVILFCSPWIILITGSQFMRVVFPISFNVLILSLYCLISITKIYSGEYVFGTFFRYTFLVVLFCLLGFISSNTLYHSRIKPVRKEMEYIQGHFEKNATLPAAVHLIRMEEHPPCVSIVVASILFQS